jgi:hypothetical protein
MKDKTAILRKRKARKRNSDLVKEYKKDKPCRDCGGLYAHYVMDFDHIDPKTKLERVSRLANQSISAKRIKEEIAKCNLLCSNCHRIQTNRRSKSK